MNQEPYLNDFKRRAFELCLAVYRVTNLLPKAEVLTNQLKEIANEITAEILTSEKINGKIEKLIVYLQIAKAQNWLKPINFEVLIKEYQGLGEEIKKEKTLRQAQGIKRLFPERPSTLAKVLGSRRVKKQEISERQKKILTYLQNKKEAKMKDFLEIFEGEITDRTLRSDLKFLLNQGLIKKQGEFKTTKYFI